MSRIWKLGFLGLVLLFGASEAHAGPILWSTADGGNGHYYDLVLPSDPSGSLTWTQARDAAANSVFEGSHGYLATVTSAAENDFLHNTFGSQLSPDYALLGGKRGDYAWIGLTDEGNIGNWRWLTGEAFSYSNWAPPEPNFFDTEFYGLYWNRDYGSGPLWSWNNAANQPFDFNQARYGYFVEYSGPFTATPEPASLTLLGVGLLGLVACGRRLRLRPA